MRLLLFDGLNLIRRIDAGIPGSEQEHSDMVARSCVSLVAKNLDYYRPSHVMFIMETSGISWRTKMNPNYKSGRPEMSADLKKTYQ